MARKCISLQDLQEATQMPRVTLSNVLKGKNVLPAMLGKVAGGTEMKTTIARETREQFNFIKHELKRGNENIMPYMSGTMKKRTMMYKETHRYEEDAKIDYELGVIGKNEYEIEMRAVRLLERALANFKVF